MDDGIMAAKELQLLEHLEAQLGEEFEVKLLGDAKLIFGMVVKRDLMRGTLHLSHAHYIRDLVDMYIRHDCCQPRCNSNNQRDNNPAW